MLPPSTASRKLLVLALSGLIACAGSSASTPGSAPAAQTVRLAAPGALAPFAAERVMVLPVQGIAPQDPLGWRARAGVEREVLARADSVLEHQFRERGLASWVYVSALVRVARRNATYLTDPYAIRATAPVRVAMRTQHQPIVEPLASQLRGLAGASDARWALVPLEVQFTADGTAAGRVRLALALIDVRGAQLRWVGDVLGDPHPDYSVAAIDAAIQRAADLVVPR